MAIRVVLADDHELFSSGTRLILEQDHGLSVVAMLGSPDDLLDYLQAHPCDLVITDFNMPGRQAPDGLELLARLRERFPAVPVIVLTMLANPGLISAMLENGARGLVNKTDAVVQLPLAVRSVLRGQRYFSRSMQALLELGSPGSDGVLQPLSDKEREILLMFASGKSVSEIAQRLDRNVKTISSQKIAAMEKLGLRSDLDIYAYVREHGLA